MKKTYISPNMLVVRFAMTQPLATSTLGLNRDDSNALDDGEILVKESSNSSIWDSEW